jgi:SAM-dependent methyltransferase
MSEQIPASVRVKALAKTAAKRAIDVGFAARVALLRAIGVVDFPVPPNTSLRTTSSTSVRHYYESGLTTLLPIITVAMREGLDFDQPVRVLDFGCGVGRQLLQLDRLFPAAEIHGCDVNHRSIAYVAKTFPRVKAVVNSFDPPLPYAAGSFDLIYSVSTFSHFAESDARLWLAELKRVARPGGLLCLTFNGLTSLERAHEKGMRQDYSGDRLMAEGRWFDADATAFDAKKTEEAASEFGSTLIGIPRLYWEMHYAPAVFAGLAEAEGFSVVATLPGIIDRYQDLLVLRA